MFYTILHPHVAAWGVREFVFNSLQSEESRGKRIITCSLAFDEFDSVSGKSQDRHLGLPPAPPAETAATPLVGDEDRAGLGKLGAAYAPR